jgi:predicted lipoprotein with Yx(FWY)xxD motif
MRRTTFATTVLAIGVVALSGCGSGGDGGSAASSPAEDAELATADSDLGTIVVDGDGMTVYVFDEDTPGSGKSNCTGGCLEAWPPVVTESDSPVVDGVTGDVGTITRDDGATQITLDGYPLYHWQGDVDAGDVTGQGVQGVWWVVAPDGSKIEEAPPPAAPDGY